MWMFASASAPSLCAGITKALSPASASEGQDTGRGCRQGTAGLRSTAAQGSAHACEGKDAGGSC